VLLVDDSADLATVVMRLIAAQPDMEATGVLQSSAGVDAEVERLRPDVLVMDLSIPGESPLEAVRALKASAAPAVHVIAYSGYDDPQTRASAREAGAEELVSKHGRIDDLLAAIRRAASTPGMKG